MGKATKINDTQTTSTQVISGPQGATLTLDPAEIGEGTPMLVEWRNQTATYDCANATGCVGCDERLPDSVLAWLDSIENDVYAWEDNAS